MDQQTVQELSSTGRHQECLLACQSLLQVNTQDSNAWKYAGKSLIALGQFENAQQCLINANQLDSSDPDTAKEIGDVFLKLGDKQKALEWFSTALAIDGNYAIAIYAIARLYGEAGNNLEAINLYQRAIQADPTLIQAYRGAAARLLKTGDLGHAKALAEQALKTNESTPGMNEILGIISQQRNDTEAAIIYYQREIKINPTAISSLLNQGLLYLQKNQHLKAVQILEKAAEFNPSDQCSALLAQGYQKLGKTREAIKEYKKLNIDQLNNKYIPFNLALCHHEIGEYKDAIEKFKEAIQLDQTFKDAWENISITLARARLDQEALYATKKTLDFDPQNFNALLTLGEIHKNLGDFNQALSHTLKALELKPQSYNAHLNLGEIYKGLGVLDQAHSYRLKSLEIKPESHDTHKNLSEIDKDLGNYDQAIASSLKELQHKQSYENTQIDVSWLYKYFDNLDKILDSNLTRLKINLDNTAIHLNLASIYKEREDLDLALSYAKKSLDLDPDNYDACMMCGIIYKELSNLDLALSYSQKAQKLKPDNPDIQLNIGGIYQLRGELDLALSCTLKALELKPFYPHAYGNLKGLMIQLTITPSNAENVTRAYELIINKDNFCHKILSNIFIQAYFTNVTRSAQLNPIITKENHALDELAADWRFKKSLTLFIAPHADFESFFKRLRKEFLLNITNKVNIPQHLGSLLKALAMQCFLNEYVYTQSEEENILVKQLVGDVNKNENLFKEYLPIIASYMPISQLELNQQWLQAYQNSSDENKELIKTQILDTKEEERIKALMRSEKKVTDAVSIKVQDMYEGKPYPRYRYADHTDKTLARNISKCIDLESTKKNLKFSDSIASNKLSPKVLIAGCGTGKQVIIASRYKNAKITAIDLSSSSLAYAIRQARYYGMNNVSFKMMDILDASNLNKTFDIIECGGVLHHMRDPHKGLSILNKKLKPGGFIKLGLYSDIARKQIKDARDFIRKSKLDGSINSIREFREQILLGKIKELSNLSQCGSDFYSLSSCNDLCFHVHEKPFTIGSIKHTLEVEGLIFCGFMLPEAIKQNYQQQFPSDTEMTSFANWSSFEYQYQSTFQSMYQFWAFKPG